MNRCDSPSLQMKIIPKKHGRFRKLVATLAIGAIVGLVLGTAGCGTAESRRGSGPSLESTLSVVPSADRSESIQELTVPTPDLSSQPEEFVSIPWGAGPGELSLGESNFGTSGPDLMAVSPDGSTVAIYDRYAASQRVNFYVDGKPEGEVDLKNAPLAMVINDDRELFALYQTRPTSTIVRIDASGEVIETISIDGALDPADLIWAGNDLYVFAGVGGTDPDGYLRVMQAGRPVPLGDFQASLDVIQEEYPLSGGMASIVKESAGSFLVAVTNASASSNRARLIPPAALGDPAGFLYGSASGGLPVVMLFVSSEEGPPIGCFVVVDVSRAEVKAATVQFDWKLPGGQAVVGSDAVYVMRLDLETGVQLLRVPFK